VCAFCGADLVRSEPVAFALVGAGDGYEWFTDGSLVASAAQINGLWQLHDARGDHVVTLVPIGECASGPAVALIGAHARLLGSIRPERESSTGASMVSDPDGRPVLVLRTDGEQGAHLVDRRGDVVAVASWEEPDAPMDLLVTALGTRHSLAMVFGLLLSFEVGRHADRRV
jgi:hypothetical protein